MSRIPRLILVLLSLLSPQLFADPTEPVERFHNGLINAMASSSYTKRVEQLNPVVGELFDLNNDPHELVNLFDEPAHQDRVKEMAERLRAWQERTGDTAPLQAI